MLKVRVMGTKRDILKFQRILKKCPELRMNEPSDIYTMKGTNNYFRNYMDRAIFSFKPV